MVPISAQKWKAKKKTQENQSTPWHKKNRKVINNYMNKHKQRHLWRLTLSIRDKFQKVATQGLYLATCTVLQE